MWCSKHVRLRLRLAVQSASGVALAVLTVMSATADDLGAIGPIYPVAEPSLLAVIRTRLQALETNGELARLESESTTQIRREVELPAPVSGVSKTTRTRTFHFDPSIEVPYPITDADGRVIVAPGTRINPLDTVSLSHPLLFIDARDTDQIERAQSLLEHHHGRLKLILTGGSYLDLMRRLKRPVYFDQQGRLTARFGIRHVPALVTQDGTQLRIDELL